MTHSLRFARRAGAALTACLVIALAAASVATAGTISRSGDGQVLYWAPTGETNAVTITGTEAAITLTDSAGLVDGDGAGGCEVSGNTATCADVALIWTDLGDQNDTLSDSSDLPDSLHGYFGLRHGHDGGPGDDTLNGSPDRDWLAGDDGNDTINGGAAGDAISGGGGNDVIDGQEGGDGWLYGVSGDAGDDTVNGGPGEDDLYGDEGADTVDGGADDDGVNGGPGADQVRGGPGLDHLYGGGDDSDAATSENDVLSGGPEADSLYGGPGDDQLNGDAGDDTAWPGPSYDAGKDTFAGGDGRDTAYYSDEDEGVKVTLDGQPGDGVSDPDEQDNIGTDVEVVFGTWHDDELTGSNGYNELYGNGGDDRLSGLGGNDWLEGASGEDVLIGGDGGDRMRGGDDADSLSGDAGNDVLTAWTDGVPDDLDGGDGVDTADLSDTGVNLVVTLDGAANDGAGGGLEGDNVKTENVLTGWGNDDVTGSAGRNVIDLGPGNDTANVSGDQGQIDDLVCGVGFDSATVDPSDAPATFGDEKCESLNGQAVATSPAAYRQPVPVPLSEKDPPKIKVTLKKCSSDLGQFKARGCLVQIKTNEQARFHIAMTAKVRSGGARIAQTLSSPLVLNDRDLGFTTGTDATVRPIVRPDRKLLRRAPKEFRVSILVEAFDRAGNVTRKTLRKTIRR